MFRSTTGLGRALKLAAAPLLLTGLSACASLGGFNADVSRFQTQLPAPDGVTFAVVADDPELAGGLEFAQYADFVEGEMAALGYTQSAPEEADLLVRFDYAVDNGRTRVRRTAGFYDPFYSPWRGYYPYRSRLRYHHIPRYTRWGYGFYDPWLSGAELRADTVYTSEIELEIDRRADGERLFEGRAQALSTSSRLPYLVPNLVEAMFTDFPGVSGETVRITVAPEDQPVQRRRR